jgi:hypothetical protein
MHLLKGVNIQISDSKLNTILSFTNNGKNCLDLCIREKIIVWDGINNRHYS